jgi:SAM-dependent methyltransferase
MISSTSNVPNFFEQGSPFLNHPLLTAERTTHEINFIEPQLNVNQGARILDVGCGFGRHSVELALRGYEVSGIDPSAALIAEARIRAAEAGVSVDFRQQWGERFSTGQAYDAAICLFTSMGQITEQGENSGLLDTVFAALKPGGHFVIEVPQRETAVRQLKVKEKFGEGDHKTSISRDYNVKTQIVSEKFRVVNGSEEHTYLLMYKLFDRPELEALLARAGFINIAAYGDYQDTALSNEAPIMLLVARKGS